MLAPPNLLWAVETLALPFAVTLWPEPETSENDAEPSGPSMCRRSLVGLDPPEDEAAQVTLWPVAAEAGETEQDAESGTQAGVTNVPPVPLDPQETRGLKSEK